jgi:hypothetical protein
MTIIDFCARNKACRKDRNWMLSTGCASMAELWELDMRPEWRVWVATRPGVLSDRDLRLFACWCVRQVRHLLPDERSRNAVEAAERFAGGEATEEELATAQSAAWDAYADASAADEDAARAAWDAYKDARVTATARATAARAAATRAAARAAAASAAAAATYDMARAAVADAAYAACSDAYVATLAAQAAYLIELGNPFKEIAK